MANPLPSKNTGPHVLVCDDDPAFSAEFSEALAARGFSTTAFLGLSALRTQLLTPTILILDICMPEPDGIEILKFLARHERKDDFSIVLVSGWDARILNMAAALCRLQGLRLLGTFQKPIDINDLCALLEADSAQWD